MKTITKHYSGEQDGYLYPRAQEIGGVSGDSDACKIFFKIPKQFETGWNKFIAFEGETYDPVLRQYVPMEYPLSSDNSFTIPAEITDQYRGKTVNYHLVLSEIATDTRIQSHSSTLYFSRSAKNTNVVTYLATHAFVDADFVINTDAEVDRPVLRFFRMDGSPDIRVLLDVPYLSTDGKIPRQFFDLDDLRVKVFQINNPSEKTSLTTAAAGDWAQVVANEHEGEMYLLTGTYSVEEDWVLIYTDNPSFKDITALSLELNGNGLTLPGDFVNKVLITDADGHVIGSEITPTELKQLQGINTDKTVQQQLDDKIKLVDEATETGGKACFAPFYMTPDFSNPELITVKVDKIRLSKNPSSSYSRVDSIDIPVPRAYVEDDNPVTGTSTAGLYTKGLADKKFSLVDYNDTGLPMSVPFGAKNIHIDAEGWDADIFKVYLDRNGLIDSYSTLTLFPNRFRAILDDEHKENDIAGLYTRSLADRKTNRAISVANGLSLMSNDYGDNGACMKFEHEDGTTSGIAVNDGGMTGVAAQIYAIKDGVSTEGVKLDVRKEGIYYLKNKVTPATEDPDDEVITLGAVKGVQMVIKSSDWTLPAGGEFFMNTVTNVKGIDENSYPIVSAINVSTTKTGIEAEMLSASYVVKGIPGNETLTFYAVQRPTTDIAIVVKVM